MKSPPNHIILPKQCPPKIWKSSSWSHLWRLNHPTWQRRPYTCPVCGWDHPLVCTRLRFNGVNGPVHNSNEAGPRNKYNDQECREIAGLSGKTIPYPQYNVMLQIWYWILIPTPRIFKGATPRTDHQEIFLGELPNDGKPIKLNGSVYTLCTILKFVASSEAEAEPGALFLNIKESHIMQHNLEKLGHLQPSTSICCYNVTT